MPPELSDKMPAQQDSQMASRFPATMKSERPPFADEGGSDDAPITPVIRDSSAPSVEWQNIDDNKAGWEAEDGEFNTKSWEVTDRKDENDEGSMPQRDPDGDGDLN